MFQKEQLELLKQFIGACKTNPDLLHAPELNFFKEWLLSLGAKIPEPSEQPGDIPNEQKTSASAAPDVEDLPNADSEPEVVESSEEEDIIESDLEIEELEGLIQTEEGGELEMGDDSLEVSEEMLDESSAKRSEAMQALSEGNIDAAIGAFTEAIKKNPQSANLYAKRASALIKAKRPAAAIRDCEKALSINKDSAQPYKWRGRANRLLGNYEAAYHDFQEACRLDWDEITYEWQKEVEKNAKKIIEHKMKYERLNKEKEIEKKKKEIKKRREQANKEYERSKQSSTGGFPGGMPGGMGGMPGGMGGMPGGMGGMPGGMGGMPGGMGGGAMPDMSALFNDPELMAAMQDPEVMAAFRDVSQNPSNMSKYEGNPKIKKVIEKLQAKFGGAGM